MKSLKYIFLLLASLFIIGGFSACNKASHNGKLDGQWQILTIEKVETGEVSVPDPSRYICINLHLMQLTGGSRPTANMTYDKKKGHISCDFPYIKTENAEKELSPWGIYTNPVVFDIVELSHKKLVLRTDATIITCRRF